VNDTTQFTTITRTDGKPLRIVTLAASKPWITATMEPGSKAYELVARLDEMPASTVSGSVSFETSVPAQPRIEVPVIVNVFKPCAIALPSPPALGSRAGQGKGRGSRQFTRWPCHSPPGDGTASRLSLL